MRECNQHLQLCRFHDNELSRAQREMMERHLMECAECRGALMHLQLMSRFLASGRLGEGMPDMSFAARGLSRRAALRFTTRLTWVAAATVLVCTLWLFWQPRQDFHATSAYGETTALAGRSDSDTKVVAEDPMIQVLLKEEWRE